jgi:hypothetical protein
MLSLTRLQPTMQNCGAESRTVLKLTLESFIRLNSSEELICLLPLQTTSLRSIFLSFTYLLLRLQSGRIHRGPSNPRPKSLYLSPIPVVAKYPTKCTLPNMSILQITGDSTYHNVPSGGIQEHIYIYIYIKRERERFHSVITTSVYATPRL